jgi:hypothetical protein
MLKQEGLNKMVDDEDNSCPSTAGGEFSQVEERIDML